MVNHLRKVMFEGIEQGIVSLQAHDAIAVKQCGAEWAKEAMGRVWSEETLGGHIYRYSTSCR